MKDVFLAIFAFTLLSPPSTAQAAWLQFAFYNHTNVKIRFLIDDGPTCVANAGMWCSSMVETGPEEHQLRAEGEGYNAEATAVFGQHTSWTVCYDDESAGSCE